MRPDLVAEGARVMTVCNACRASAASRLSGVPRAGATVDFRPRRSRLPGHVVPQLRRVPLRVPVRAAARVRHQRSAHARRASARHLRDVLLARPARGGIPPAQDLHGNRLDGGLRGRAGGGDRVLDPAAWTRAGTSGRSTRWCRTASWCRYLVPSASSSARRWPLASTVSATTSRRRSAPVVRRGTAQALRDVLSLRHLHPQGVDCVHGEEARAPWRRWLHHATFYGFVSCFLSTSTAAVYHTVFGWQAPYAYTSLPVALGTVGGVGLMVGPAGLLLLGRRRDPMLQDPAQSGLDASFLTLLLIASSTGLVLLGGDTPPRCPRCSSSTSARCWRSSRRCPMASSSMACTGRRARAQRARERATSAERIRTPSDGTANDRTLRGAPHQRRARGGARLDARHPHAARASAHRRGRSRAQPLPRVAVVGRRTPALDDPRDARAHLRPRGRRAASLDGIRTIHRRVNGRLRTTVGRFPTGTAYSAEDPALVRWVHLTLLESLPLAYEALVGPWHRRSRYLLRGVGLGGDSAGCARRRGASILADACASIAEVHRLRRPRRRRPGSRPRGSGDETHRHADRAAAQLGTYASRSGCCRRGCGSSTGCTGRRRVTAARTGHGIDPRHSSRHARCARLLAAGARRPLNRHTPFKVRLTPARSPTWSSFAALDRT